MAARKIEYLAEINCAIGLTGNLTRNDPKRPKCVDNGLCLSLKYAEGVHKFQPRVASTLGKRQATTTNSEGVREVSRQRLQR